MVESVRMIAKIGVLQDNIGVLQDKILLETYWHQRMHKCSTIHI